MPFTFNNERYFAKMTFTAKQILEQYVLGKDTDQYELLETIFADSAVVEFEIRSEKISFPEKIQGNNDIARILSKDFNEKYESVKTYYLQGVGEDSDKIDTQPWLVVMKEIGVDVTRIGTGYYSWEMSNTDSGLKVSKLKIYIYEMLEVVDWESAILTEIQSKIEYPWPAFLTVINALNSYRTLNVVADYIRRSKHSGQTTTS